MPGDRVAKLKVPGVDVARPCARADSRLRAKLRNLSPGLPANRRQCSGAISSPAMDTVAVHTTGVGLDLGDLQCEATTRRGLQCRNPLIYGQEWQGGAREVDLGPTPTAQRLAQRRCIVHVDPLATPVIVRLIFDDSGV